MTIDFKQGGIGAFLGAVVVAAGGLGLHFLGSDTQAQLLAKGIVHYCSLEDSARAEFRTAIGTALQAEGVTYMPRLCE